MPASYIVGIYPRLRQPDGTILAADPIVTFDDTTGSVRWVVDGTGEANFTVPVASKASLIGRLQTNRYEAWVFQDGLLLHRGIITNIRDRPNSPIEIESKDWSYLWKNRPLREDIAPNLITFETEGFWDVSELAEACVRAGMRPDWHEPNAQIITELSGTITNASISKTERRILSSTMSSLGSIIDWTIIGGVLYIFGPREKKSFELYTNDFRDVPYVEMDGININSRVEVEGKSDINGRVSGSAKSEGLWGYGVEYVSSDYPDDASATAAAISSLADSDQPKIVVSASSTIKESAGLDARLVVPGSLGIIHVGEDYITHGSYNVRVTETVFDWANGSDDDVQNNDDDTKLGMSMTLVSPGAGYYSMKSRSYERALPGFLERLDSRLNELEKDRVDGKLFDGTRSQVDQIQEKLIEFGIT